MGFPSRSLTLIFWPFSVRARNETLVRWTNGFVQWKPFVFSVPR